MRKILFILLAVGLVPAVHAVPVFTNTAVVGTATNSATFDAITSNTTDLNGYSEDGIIVSVPDSSNVGFDAFNGGPTTGFHYGDGGNFSWVTISMVSGASISALDFLLGDGNPSTTTNLIWETFQGATSTGFGDAGFLSKGTTVGWTDTAGFTSIRVAALGFDISSFGEFQAIALDNVRIAAPAVVPVPAAVWLFGSALGVMGVMRRKISS